MKNLILLCAVLLLLLGVNQTAKAGTETTSEVRTSNPYHAIVMQGDAELVLVPSQKFEITLEGTKDQIINMVTILKNDTLFITQMNKKDKRDKRTRILLNVDEITSLEIIGKTTVIANGHINTDRLTIRAEAGAVVNLDLRALNVKAKSSGGSQINTIGINGSSN